MSFKLNIALGILLSSLLLNGCSSDIAKKQPLYNPNFITTLLYKDVMPAEPARHAKITMEPAVKLMQEFHKEIDSIGGLKAEDIQNTEKLQKIADIANKYSSQITKIRKDMLLWGDAIVPHVRYIYQINSYVNHSAAELKKVSQLSSAKVESRKALFQQIESHNLYQNVAAIGYEHYKLVLTKGEHAYQLDKQKVKNLKKGMTYYDVVKVLQMPGEYQRPGEIIWVHNDVVLFAGFKQGKLDFWKLNGAY